MAVYSAVSAKASQGASMGVSEMFETGAMRLMQEQRRDTIEGLTHDMEEGLFREMIEDGANSALGVWSSGIMIAQEALLDEGITRGRNLVVGLYASSKIKNLFKGKYRKGRKASMFSKFLSGNDSTAEKGRLIADFSKMDITASSSSHAPVTRESRVKSKYMYEEHEVNKEATRTRLAKLQLDGLTRSFDWKLKTSSFSSLDKYLIKEVTGVATVSDDYIDKLNSQSNAQSFKDSSGNWIGGNQANVMLMTGLGLHNVT